MKQFMQNLEQHLHSLPEHDRKDILRDYEEMLLDAVRSGKSETEAIKALGDPKQLARALTAESLVAKISDEKSPAGESPRPIEKAKDIGRALLAVAALAPFNLIFVFGPFMAIVGCLIAGWAVSLGLLAAAVGVLGAALVESVATGVSFWAGLSGALLGGGGAFLCLSGVMVMTWFTVIFGKLTVQYLRWNIRLVSPESKI